VRRFCPVLVCFLPVFGEADLADRANAAGAESIRKAASDVERKRFMQV
jgi:hypothetical protein